MTLREIKIMVKNNDKCFGFNFYRTLNQLRLLEKLLHLKILFFWGSVEMSLNLSNSLSFILSNSGWILWSQIATRGDLRQEEWNTKKKIKITIKKDKNAHIDYENLIFFNLN